MNSLAPQVHLQAHFSGHRQVRPFRERPDEREQFSRGGRDGKVTRGPSGAAPDEGPCTVGGYDGDAAERGLGKVCGVTRTGRAESHHTVGSWLPSPIGFLLAHPADTPVLHAVRAAAPLSSICSSSPAGSLLVQSGRIFVHRPAKTAVLRAASAAVSHFVQTGWVFYIL